MAIREYFIPKMRKLKKEEFKDKLFSVVFESDTYLGKLFDIIVMLLILCSVTLVIMETIPSVNAKYHKVLIVCEVYVTVLFTLEYMTRIYCSKKPWSYIISFYGIIDLLSLLPTYIGIFYPAGKYLASIRIFRLLRIFRVFNLTQINQGRATLVLALKQSRAKIIVFVSFVLLVTIVIGSIMYVIESGHPESGFTSIPVGIYWAIVTMTTVGYGDVAPVTPLGQFLASMIMILGYGIIAVPTGIVSMEINHATKREAEVNNTQVCPNCHDSKHLDGAKYCKTCGNLLNPPVNS